MISIDILITYIVYGYNKVDHKYNSMMVYQSSHCKYNYGNNNLQSRKNFKISRVAILLNNMQ